MWLDPVMMLFQANIFNSKGKVYCGATGATQGSMNGSMYNPDMSIVGSLLDAETPCDEWLSDRVDVSHACLQRQLLFGQQTHVRLEGHLHRAHTDLTSRWHV